MYIEKYYKVNESELRELIRDSMTLCALEHGGLDSWEWYGYSIQDFIKANGGNPDDDIYDIAEKELENYDTLDDQSVIIMKYIDQANPFRLTKEDYKHFDKLFEDIDQMRIIHHPDGSMEYNP